MSYQAPNRGYASPADSMMYAYQRRRDEDHLGLLAIFHYILGGLTILAGFYFLIYVAMGVFFVKMPASAFETPSTPTAIHQTAVASSATVADPFSRKAPNALPSPAASRPNVPALHGAEDAPDFNSLPRLGWIFALFGGITFLLCAVVGALTIWSGVCLKKHVRPVYSTVIAALNCLDAPFGTLLGVFTLFVLARPSVKALYNPALAAEPPGASSFDL